MKFQILYHLSKSKKLHSWEIWVENDIIFSLAGTLDGKKILSQKIATPKNEGKKNATTANEQAEKEAQSMWQHKLDRKYSLTKEEAQVIDEIAPMLAQDYYKRKNKIAFPVLIEPKLDGIRSLAFWEDGKVVLKSRGNKYLTNLNHITDELEKFLPKDMIFDGELYVKDIPFQVLVSWIKKFQPNTNKIQYHIYDSTNINIEENTLTRKENIKSIMPSNSNNLFFVQSYSANNEEDVEKYHSQFVSEGYEGAMVRILDGLYDFGYRSNFLLKVKSFQDDEFEVIDFTQGIGKFSGCIIFICKTKDGKEFKVVPKVSESEKKEMFKNGKDYIGEMLTVKYFGVSEDGVPRFPVGLKFKPAEEFN